MNLPKLKEQRAYSTFEIKSVDDSGDMRVITGIASTPTVDRGEDIVEPAGAVFALPIPLLWQHRSDSPIGNVTKAKVMKTGIEVTCEIAKGVAGYIDEAWALIKAGLVRGFSIGFAPLEYSHIENSYGYRFLKWEWLELSAVTIPMNAEASIQTIKSIDRAVLARMPGAPRVVSLLPGDSGTASPETLLPGASGTTPASTKGNDMKTIAEQIAAAEAKRAQIVGAMSAIMAKSAEAGTTLDKTDGEDYDAKGAEVKSIDAHIARLKSQEELELRTATPIVREQPQGSQGASEGNQQQLATEQRSGVLLVKDNLPKGTEFARYVKCLAATHGNRQEALELAQHNYPQMKRLHNILSPGVQMALKTAVAGGTIGDATWAGALVDYTHFANDFVDYLRPQTIIGKFGQNGIPALRAVPFNIQVPSQTSAGAGYWVGEGKAKPLTKFDWTNITLRWSKVANIAVLTDELVRFSNPAADVLVRNALAEAIIARIDTDFVDPSKAAVVDVSPASITNGLTPIVPSGIDADAVRTDVAAVMAVFLAANLTPSDGVWIMSANQALTLSLMRNTLGQKEFPDLTMLGGRFEGLPVIVSNYVTGSVSGGFSLILVNASDIYLADDGQVTIDASREASLEMSDAPSSSAGTGTGASLVSMFQTNSVAIRAERWINWKKRRSAAVAYVDGTHYAI